MTENPDKFTDDNKASLINFSRPFFNPREPLASFQNFLLPEKIKNSENFGGPPTFRNMIESHELLRI